MKLGIILFLVIIGILALVVGLVLYIKKVKELQNEITQKQEQLTSTEHDILQANSTKALIEEQVAQLQKEVITWESKNNRLATENSVEEAHLNDRRAKLEELNQLFKQNEQQINTTKQRNAEILEQVNAEFQDQLQQLQGTYSEKADEYEQQLSDLRDKRNAAIEQAIKEFEEKDKLGFYMLQLTDKQLSDIYLLRQLESRLNNKEVIGKILYKVYYEKAYTDLIGRVLDKKDFSGIYKITNQINKMCYIGQAVNIKKRWQQHIKRAIGAEPLTNNKLYPAMREFGIENFTFEVVDKCDRTRLNEREKYWTEYYKGQIYGYNIRKG